MELKLWDQKSLDRLICFFCNLANPNPTKYWISNMSLNIDAVGGSLPFAKTIQFLLLSVVELMVVDGRNGKSWSVPYVTI